MARSAFHSSLAVCLLIVALSTGRAAPMVPHILSNIPRPLPTVSLHHAFAIASHSHQMVVGGDSEVLLTIRNDHSAPINVTHIAGSINAPSSFAFHIQNLTTIAYKATVPANTERSFAYKFQVTPQLPSRAYTVALTAFYDDLSGDAASRHASTFFNQTVEFVEPERFIDTEAYSLLLTLAAIAGGIAYMVYRSVHHQPWFKSMFKTKKSKVKAPVASGPTDKSDYLVGTSYHLEKKKKAAADSRKAK